MSVYSASITPTGHLTVSRSEWVQHDEQPIVETIHDFDWRDVGSAMRHVVELGFQISGWTRLHGDDGTTYFSVLKLREVAS
jgi:hypothetical protein